MSSKPRTLPTIPRNQGAAVPHYTCSDYREEMIILALRQKVQRQDLTEEERVSLVEEIGRLEKALGF